MFKLVSTTTISLVLYDADGQFLSENQQGFKTNLKKNKVLKRKPKSSLWRSLLAKRAGDFPDCKNIDIFKSYVILKFFNNRSF